MTHCTDLIILGGGCAGLSLGERLTESPPRSHQTIVIEARPAYVTDRTWCFWRTAPHRHDALVAKSWTRLQLQSAGRSVLVDCRKAPYQMLESGSFYERAEGLIHRSTSVESKPDGSSRITRRHSADARRASLDWVRGVLLRNAQCAPCHPDVSLRGPKLARLSHQRCDGTHGIGAACCLRRVDVSRSQFAVPRRDTISVRRTGCTDRPAYGAG